ncbi:hypothetical protein CU254_41485 (plasmid) [Amycolatopsis sp. AA4]|uniref:hypothetical protein n=1 Tax=Actinomycetes TaxID=1760 RepID=UPI0001B556BF|nr:MULTISPECIES: hypothetical protein [Actinomycetes]ATY17060.1 hypothetical protein CU254_41485 [Amycolatopsis sp. AA4]
MQPKLPHLDLPHDVLRLVRLSAAIAGETPEEWVSELVRRHVDTVPPPRGPLLIESPAAAESEDHSDGEPASDAAENAKRAEGRDERVLDDTALVLTTLAGSDLLNGDSHVSAAALLGLMREQHKWPAGPKGFRRLSAALVSARVAAASVTRGTSKVKSYPAKALQRALDKLR